MGAKLTNKFRRTSPYGPRLIQPVTRSQQVSSGDAGVGSWILVQFGVVPLRQISPRDTLQFVPHLFDCSKGFLNFFSKKIDRGGVAELVEHGGAV